MKNRGLFIFSIALLALAPMLAASPTNNEEVRQAQTALQEKGFDSGPIDGVMGPRTRSALREFQRTNNLPVSGRLDSETMTALGLETGGTLTARRETVSMPTAKRTANGKAAKNGSPDRPARIPDELEDYWERATEAAEVLSKLPKGVDKGIPDELLVRTHAIAVIPDMIKGAFGFGGRHGKGLIAKRMGRNQWGTPSFIDVSGGSFGLQIGVSKTDLVLFFTDENAVKELMDDKGLKLGADAAVAAGPVGRTAEIGTNITFDEPIYAYSRSKGLFAGISLEGAVMNINDSANEKVYGKGVTGTDILINGTVPSPPVVRPFLDALKQYVPPRTK